jgi:predicted metal-binding protein
VAQLPFHLADPAHTDFQYLEDLATGYWYSEVLFAALELKLFDILDGFHKAFVFGAGPCPVCESCPTDGSCRHSDLARPSMEGSGIDVFETAENAGIPLKPLRQKDHYIKYFGLLLLE